MFSTISVVLGGSLATGPSRSFSRLPNFRGIATIARSSACGALMSGCALSLALIACPAKLTAKETVLYSFQGGMKDGDGPVSGLVRDDAGNLYGTTPFGGGETDCLDYGCGTVFEIAPDGKETVLYVFKGKADGAEPWAGLIEDGAGNFYGTARNAGGGGVGVVFKVTSGGREKVLHTFGGTDGASPYASLLSDEKGSLYGTTSGGGAYGSGTVFVLAPNGTETVLYSFAGGEDGSQPVANLIGDQYGNLYSTTSAGGADSYGTVFRLSPPAKGQTQWTEAVLYSFMGGSDGRGPLGGLVMDNSGNLYGTTQNGGNGNCNAGCGTIFKLSSNGKEKVLHTFTGENDGLNPEAALMADSAGNLYGTASGGGLYLQGNVFRFEPSGHEKVLYSFKRGRTGYAPFSSLIMDSSGNLYGTTLDGGTGSCEDNGCGTVFELAQ